MESVTVTGSIGKNAFNGCTGLKSVVLEDGVTSIGDGSFNDCTGLTSIEIPGSVQSLGNSIFAGLTSLTSVTLKDGVKSIGGGAFSGCTGLTSIEIPSSVQSLGGSVFSGCTGLTSIEIPSSVRSLGGSVFSGCTGLTSLEIPGSVKNTGSNLVDGCSNLTTVILQDGVGVGKQAFFQFNGNIEIRGVLSGVGESAFEGTNLTSVTVAGGTIDKQAFLNCGNLESVNILNGVTRIGKNAFGGCSNLTSLNIPYGVLTIDDGAFSYCGGLTSITIPGSVKAMGRSIINNSPNINSVTIKDGAYIGASAFYDCKGCKFTIEGSLSGVEEYAFFGCTGLDSVAVSGDIDKGAFAGCSNLTSLKLTDGITKIGESVFSECSGLTSITVWTETPPSLGENAFKGVPSDIPVYVFDTAAFSNSDWGAYFSNFIQIDLDELRSMALESINAAIPENGSEYFTNMLQQHINVIKYTNAPSLIVQERDKALSVLQSAVPAYEQGRTESFGSLGTKQNGPAVKVADQNDKEVILYNPKKIDFIKVEE